MKFIIFHGSFGTPNSHWFPYLKNELQKLHQEVFVPTFPVDDWEQMTNDGPTIPPKKQNLQSWMNAFSSWFDKLSKSEPYCFIGHSLGCLFILHVVENYNLTLDSAIFVCPFLHKLNRSWQIDAVNESFYKTDFDFHFLQQHIPLSYALFSDNDPYVDRSYVVEFAEHLHSAPIVIKGGAHLNQEVNLIKFPLVLELCKTRLNLPKG